MLEGVFLDEYKNFEKILNSGLPQSVVKDYYFNLLKRFHPDKNANDKTSIYAEFSSKIIELYQTYSKKQIPKDVIYKSYSYKDFFGKYKKYNIYVDFVFHYAVDCYLAAKHLYFFQKNSINALKVCKQSLLCFSFLLEHYSEHPKTKVFLDAKKEANQLKNFLLLESNDKKMKEKYKTIIEKIKKQRESIN